MSEDILHWRSSADIHRGVREIMEAEHFCMKQSAIAGACVQLL